MTSVSDDCENRDDGGNDIPIQRKNWESPDYTISKILVKEGDLTAWRPRTGATGEMRLIVKSVTGVDKSQLMSSTTVDKSQLVSNTTVDKSQLMSSTTISNYFSQLNEDKEDGGKQKTSETTNVIEFLIGSAETEVDRTLEKCLQSFLPGEVSLVTMRSLIEPALNTKVTQLKPSLSRESVWVILECELELASLLNAEPVYKWFPQTKLSTARDCHSAGVRLFQEQRYLDAFHKFQRAFQFSVLALGPADAEQKIGKEGNKETSASQDDCLEECRTLKQMCYNNIAACHFQWRHFSWVVELSDLVLNNDPDLVKTLYRRGVSHMELQQYDLAEMDLVRAHKLDPSNRAVNEKLGQVKQRQKAHDTKLAKQMSKMFA